MMYFWRKTPQNEPYWKSAKLIIAYHIHRTPEQKRYHRDEFSYPTHYPRFLNSFEGEVLFEDLPIDIQFEDEHFHVERDQKKLGSQLRAYLKDFRNGKLTHPERSYFSYEFCRDILEGLFKRMAFSRGSEFSLILGDLSLGDDFHCYFQKKHPEDFESWEKAQVHFPFHETLLSMDVLGRIEIIAYDARYKKLYLKLPKKDKNLFSKAISLLKEERITNIQVIPGEDKSFRVFVNGKIFNPIRFDLKNKSSQVLFKLAKEGDIPIKNFKSAYHYIQQNKEFKLFTQSGIQHHKILDHFDGYIIPAKGVKFYLMDEAELENL